MKKSTTIEYKISFKGLKIILNIKGTNWIKIYASS